MTPATINTENPMRLTLLSLTLAICTHATTCFADIIYLKNGDRLTGKISTMEDGKLTFWTKYTGEIILFWQDIDHFTMDDTSKVILKPVVAPESPETAELTESSEETKSIDVGESAEIEMAEPIEDGILATTEITPDQVLAINPTPPVPVKIVASVNSKVTGERGNAHKDVYSFRGAFTARTDSHRYAFDGVYENEKKNKIVTEDNWLLHSKISSFLDTEKYIYMDVLYENDKFKDLKLRSTYGVGAGYQFAEKAQLNLSFSLGLAWVTDEFYLADGKDFSAGQWAIDFDRYFFRNKFQFFHSDHGYVSLEHKNNWLVKSKTGLKMDMYGGFTATIQYEYEWDNEPASDAEVEYDSTIMLLFGYEFKN